MFSPQNSITRLTELTNSDLDYLELEKEFNHLIEIAKNITRLEVSLLNLIDAHHLWPISQSGANFHAMPLIDMPCQYTVNSDDYFEVKDLSNHDVLKEKDYVKEDPFYKYYLGVPLQTQEGINIGSICFFDTISQELNDKQIKLLGLVAKEAVSKIVAIKSHYNLLKKFFEYRDVQRKIANDLRNPLAGIIGLSDVLIEQFEDLDQTEAKDYNYLINSSSKSILSVLDAVIIDQNKQEIITNTIGLDSLKERLISLYSPLLEPKNLKLAITVNNLKANILFLKSNVNYLVGSLLVESLLNVDEKGTLNIDLDLIIKVDQLFIKAEFSSENFSNNLNLANNEVLKVYENKVAQLGGTLNLNQTKNQLFELTLPLKSI